MSERIVRYCAEDLKRLDNFKQLSGQREDVIIPIFDQVFYTWRMWLHKEEELPGHYLKEIGANSHESSYLACFGNGPVKIRATKKKLGVGVNEPCLVSSVSFEPIFGNEDAENARDNLERLARKIVLDGVLKITSGNLAPYSGNLDQRVASFYSL